MSVLPNQTNVNLTETFFLRVNASTITTNSFASDRATIQQLNVSSISTGVVILDGANLTAAGGALFYNGEELATVSGASVDWSTHPAIADVQMATYNLLNATNITGSGTITGANLTATSGLTANTANIALTLNSKNINSSNIVNSNDITTTTLEATGTIQANTFNGPNFIGTTATFATLNTTNASNANNLYSGSVSTLKFQSSNAFISTLAVNNLSSLYLSTGSLYANTATLSNLTATNITASNITAATNINTNTLTATGVITASGGINGNLSGNTNGTHTGQQNGNVSGNVSGNLTGDVTGNIYNTNLNVGAKYSINETADVGSAIADYANNANLNITARGGLGGLINITADVATPINPLTTVSQVRVEAKGNYGLITPGTPVGYVPRGGLVSIQADAGLTPSPPAEVTSALFANGEIDLTAYSYGTVAGQIKLSAGANSIYAGPVSPIVGIIGTNNIYGTVANTITAGTPPSVIPTFPGTNYLYGYNGTSIQNTLYVDNIKNYGNGITYSNLNITATNSKYVDITQCQRLGMANNPVIDGGSVNGVIQNFSNVNSIIFNGTDAVLAGGISTVQLSTAEAFISSINGIDITTLVPYTDNPTFNSISTNQISSGVGYFGIEYVSSITGLNLGTLSIYNNSSINISTGKNFSVVAKTPGCGVAIETNILNVVADDFYGLQATGTTQSYIRTQNAGLLMACSSLSIQATQADALFTANNGYLTLGSALGTELKNISSVNGVPYSANDTALWASYVASQAVNFNNYGGSNLSFLQNATADMNITANGTQMNLGKYATYLTAVATSALAITTYNQPLEITSLASLNLTGSNTLLKGSNVNITSVLSNVAIGSALSTIINANSFYMNTNNVYLDDVKLRISSIDTDSLSTGIIQSGSIYTNTLSTGSLYAGSLNFGSIINPILDVNSISTGSLYTGLISTSLINGNSNVSISTINFNVNAIGLGPAVNTTNFSYTGSDQTWTVPYGVNSVQVVLNGAGGGSNARGSYDTPGSGGLVSGTLAVTPGTVLTIVVGASGGTTPLTTTLYGGGGAGAANGGGGTNGGGRSAIQITAGTDWVVAGGGGGSGAVGSRNTGGNGGGRTGGNGNGVSGSGAESGGQGGTQSAGGAPYPSSSRPTPNNPGSSGTLGVGGNAPLSDPSTGTGSGGGGYYGGGSGSYDAPDAGSYGGGGGGSSYTPNLTGVIVDNQGGGAGPMIDGSVSISYATAPLPAVNISTTSVAIQGDLSISGRLFGSFKGIYSCLQVVGVSISGSGPASGNASALVSYGGALNFSTADYYPEGYITIISNPGASGLQYLMNYALTYSDNGSGIWQLNLYFMYNLYTPIDVTIQTRMTPKTMIFY